MDSCHIFNFLFGARKTTSELRKCFSNTLNDNTSTSGENCRTTKQAKANDTQPQQCATKTNRATTQSPLKQIQLKLANLSSATIKSTLKSNTSSQQANVDIDGLQPLTTTNRCSELMADINQVSCDVHCGTYTAKLVELPQTSGESDNDNDEEEEEATLVVDLKPSQCQTIVDENNNNNNTKQQYCTINKSSELISHDSNNNYKKSNNNNVRETVVLYDNPCNCQDNNDDDDYQNNQEQVVEDKQQTLLNHTRRQHYSGQHNSSKVRNLVQSFESSSSSSPPATTTTNTLASCTSPSRVINFKLNKWPPELITGDKQIEPKTELQININQKPCTIVKPLPPKTPPKSTRAKCLNLQLTLNKPRKIHQLFCDERFLRRHFFNKLQPIDRCAAAQVCRLWRTILYSNHEYWRDLVGVIDCTELRREHLIECILNTLETAKSKHSTTTTSNQRALYTTIGQQQQQAVDRLLDVDEVWRIQELCNRFSRCATGGVNSFSSRSLISFNQAQQQPNDIHNNHVDNHNQQHHQQQQQASCFDNMANSKSSSIPSQISSTLSSMSLSSLLSPLSESSRVDSIREKLYLALDERGFDAICLFGATDDDIDDLVCKTRPNGARRNIRIGRLNNCSITDKGFELFAQTFSALEELELTGCNEITNLIEFKQLTHLKRLIITDCINVADGLAQHLIDVFYQLDEFIIQAYHLTDSFLDFISLNSNTHKLNRLELPNCKELTNNSMATIAKHFQNVHVLSISGSTKINDDGIEILVEHTKRLQALDLSWCTKISDVSLECIACDLGAQLTELILDRNIHITDIGLGYLATMSSLELLYIRWCARITDIGLESILTMKSLRRLSLAGLQQITARSLLCLADTTSGQLEEVELTNCGAVNGDLIQFLTVKLPNCNIIF